jgi:hypothetical protein
MSVETAKQNGWKVGDILESGEGKKLCRIELRYIGEDIVVVKELMWWGRVQNSPEAEFDLTARVWRLVGKDN